MKAIQFLRSESGTVTVDWAVLAAAVGMMSLTSAGLITVASDRFSDYNAREIAMRHDGGRLLDLAGYAPSDAPLFDAYVEGLEELELEELDTLAGYANRLDLQGVMLADPSGADSGEARDALAAKRDFVAAVNEAYRARGVARPTHSRVDARAVDAALNALGLGRNEVAALSAPLTLG